MLNELGVGNCGAVPGHLIPNYPKVLRLGFRGIAAELEEMQRAEKDRSKRDFLRALLICCQAAQAFAGRYAEEAERLAEQEPDGQRQAELREIARICRKVPWEPAETFHEALQSLWFAHMLVMAAESYPGPGLSPGRIDQYLYPYYQGDLAAGRLDREQARELLQCYWLKHNYAYDYQGRVGPNQGINSGFGQLITLGGIGPDGEDASNDLTWLMLDVIEDMNLLEPKPNIRLHQKTPEDLLQRVAGLIAQRPGLPLPPQLRRGGHPRPGVAGAARRPPLGLRARGLPGEHPPGLRPLRHRRRQPEHRQGRRAGPQRRAGHAHRPPPRAPHRRPAHLRRLPGLPRRLQGAAQGPPGAHHRLQQRRRRRPRRLRADAVPEHPGGRLRRERPRRHAGRRPTTTTSPSRASPWPRPWTPWPPSSGWSTTSAG